MHNYWEKDGIHARLVTRAIIKDTAGRYFFERRPLNSEFSPNRLQLFGGKVDLEDTSLEVALVRELIEELNIQANHILSVEHIGAELSPDGWWLTYFFIVTLVDKVLEQLTAVDNLEILNQDELKIESRSIIDEHRGGDIAFDHGTIVLENL